MGKRKRKLREMAWERLSFGLPVTVWGRPRAVRVQIGKRFLWFHGDWKGNTFLVPMERICRWGAGDGPRVTDAEREQLAHILSRKTGPSPYLRLVFCEGGEPVRYGRDGRNECGES